MATLEGMVEHCDRCQKQLEIGQIGLCDDCQDDDGSPNEVTVCITVRVIDRNALARAAAARAVEDGMTPEQWQDLRDDAEDDLIMLLDPGSLPGCEILQSSIGEGAL